MRKGSLNELAGGRPVSAVLAGIGGFGQSHMRAFLALEDAGEAKLAGACDPSVGKLRGAETVEEFARRGCVFFEDLESALRELAPDLVTIAAPIPAHASLHEMCVDSGRPCYLEKPPSLDPEELERMIRTDAGAAVPTQVGFNYIYQSDRLALKERLLAGEFGALRRVAFHGQWQRERSYYTRSTWSGRLWAGEALVLDSCAGNAMAHHLHNVLFFAGNRAVMDWAAPEGLTCELYRANEIEGPDTVFARGALANGVELRLALSHACGEDCTREEVECERATLVFTRPDTFTVRWHDGGTEISEAGVHGSHLQHNLTHYIELLRGNRQRVLTALEDSRPFVHLNALLYLAAGRIHDIPDSRKAQKPGRKGGATWLIEGVEAAGEEMLRAGRLPSEQPGCAWGRPGGAASVEDLPRLRERVRELAVDSAAAVPPPPEK